MPTFPLPQHWESTNTQSRIKFSTSQSNLLKATTTKPNSTSTYSLKPNFPTHFISSWIISSMMELKPVYKSTTN